MSSGGDGVYSDLHGVEESGVRGDRRQEARAISKPLTVGRLHEVCGTNAIAIGPDRGIIRPQNTTYSML